MSPPEVIGGKIFMLVITLVPEKGDQLAAEYAPGAVIFIMSTNENHQNGSI